jgi:protein SCO1/2
MAPVRRPWTGRFRRTCLAFAVLLVGCLASPFLLVGCGGSSAEPSTAPTFAGISREPPPQVDHTPLPNVAESGAPVEIRAQAPGALMLVYFGYTFCPDVCPTTLSDVRRALGRLAPRERRRVQVAMVTVDPRRDTPKALTRYVHAFFPAGLALRTTNARALARVARSLGAAYQVTRKRDGTVEVVHTAFVYAVDHEGRLRLQWSYGTKPAALRRDIHLLLEEQRPATSPRVDG